MLVLDPTKRYSVSQIKRHRWMQADIPLSLPSTMPSSKIQPNEQILRLMQSLGIDSIKTRDSVRCGSYDHHAAIYYLLLEKLRNQLIGNETQQQNTAVREVQRRRPSNIAEQAMRKIGRASTSEDCRRLLQHSVTAPSSSNSRLSSPRTCNSPRNCDSPPHGIDAARLLAATNSDEALKILQQSTTMSFVMSSEASKLMATLQSSPVPPQTDLSSAREYLSHINSYLHSQNTQSSIESDNNKGSLPKFSTSGYRSSEMHIQYSSSTDEGVETDLEDQSHHRLSYASSSSSSGVVGNFNTSKSLSQNLSCDSNFESLDYQLSDSNELTNSLPSCTSSADRTVPGPSLTSFSGLSSPTPSYLINSRSLLSRHNPLVHLPNLKSSSRGLTRSPVDFREGRRASDGLVAQQAADTPHKKVVAFNSQKLSKNPKAKGILELHMVKKEAQRLRSQYQAREAPEEASHRQKQHNQYLQPRSSKRISLPDSFSYASSSPEPLQTAMQHRLLQQKRQILQKQSGISSHQPSSAISLESGPLSRRHMLRQASYKIAQQQPVLPPLPHNTEVENKDLVAFQAIVEGTGEAWSTLPGSLQASCQISDAASAHPWQNIAPAWNQGPQFPSNVWPPLLPLSESPILELTEQTETM
ncbi:serine/threonine-protein kinase SIK2-like [Agrilus planipennis]|uniref:Serine/threonine-protein kinase SIK2-like n=1 Tax=Agrilus planipennis TaxID=224129 RepID=A0A7F5QWD4_AGRPL|nr:serine/threonine-protein kinase SIK2-like [Agrilus planipennis]